VTLSDNVRKKYSIRQFNEIYYNLATKHIALNKEGASPEIPVPGKSTFSPGEHGTPPPQNFFGSKSDNMTYTSYNFGEFKILVRCRIDGYIHEDLPQLGPQSFSQPLGLSHGDGKKKRLVGTKCKLDYLVKEQGYYFLRRKEEGGRERNERNERKDGRGKEEGGSRKEEGGRGKGEGEGRKEGEG
jgi:hypothetical protein